MPTDTYTYINELLHNMGPIIIIDRKSNIIYMNKQYSEFFHVPIKTSIGHKMKDVISDAILPEIMKTGRDEIGCLYRKDDKIVIVNRILLRDHGEVIGAAAFASFVTYYETKTVQDKLSNLKEELELFKQSLREIIQTKYNIDSIITQNKRLIELKDITRNIAKTTSNVLISGESGVGKELFAHAIHQLSLRKLHPFIRINCAAIPDNLLESELYGYESGSFTGALKEGKMGKFELANRGTLLLDEIDSLPMQFQAKLLRTVQEKEIQKIGGETIIDVDVRLIFTSNKNLWNQVLEGKFREDLFYRINVIELNIPPLRERKDDIPMLVNHFISKFNQSLGLYISGINDEAMKLLQNFDWPGNIRELENSIERAFNFALSGELKVEHFNFLNIKASLNNKLEQDKITLSEAREYAEKLVIKNAYIKYSGNISLMAKQLEIDRSVLYKKIEKYNIRGKK